MNDMKMKMNTINNNVLFISTLEYFTPDDHKSRTVISSYDNLNEAKDSIDRNSRLLLQYGENSSLNLYEIPLEDHAYLSKSYTVHDEEIQSALTKLGKQDAYLDILNRTDAGQESSKRTISDIVEQNVKHAQETSQPVVMTQVKDVQEQHVQEQHVQEQHVQETVVEQDEKKVNSDDVVDNVNIDKNMQIPSRLRWITGE
jgi:hypothetical protein